MGRTSGGNIMEKDDKFTGGRDRTARRDQNGVRIEM